MKLPVASNNNQTKPNIVNTFAHVNDMTSTMLDYAGVQIPGSTYKGHPVIPIMGKSIKPFLEGKVVQIYMQMMNLWPKKCLTILLFSWDPGKQKSFLDYL
jgi:arylsulfatase A-like enzyme